MKIAVSGTHRVGKTSLIDELMAFLPGYERVEEPYYLLEEEGHVFAEMPSLEDFERQLVRSIRSINESKGNVIFDRCPYDFIAYLLTHDDSDLFDANNWLRRVKTAVEHLDLIVFVPIEDPDRILAEADDGLRRRVSEELESLILEDSCDHGLNVIEVKGSIEERVQIVLRNLKSQQGAHR